MADVKCVVCGEPWDGLSDMKVWEQNLFKSGAGCPACEGEVKEGKEFKPKSIFDLENGDGDEMDRIVALTASPRPKWQRPADKCLWECDACKAKVMEDCDEFDVENNLYVTPANSVLAHRHWLDLERECQNVVNDKKICPACVEICESCSETICGRLSTDVYDGFASFPGSSMRTCLCINCYENRDDDDDDEEDED